MDAPFGFEPKLKASKASVLPLDDGAKMINSDANCNKKPINTQSLDLEINQMIDHLQFMQLYWGEFY